MEAGAPLGCLLTCREVWAEWKENREGMGRVEGNRRGGGEVELRVASRGHQL